MESVENSKELQELREASQISLEELQQTKAKEEQEKKEEAKRKAESSKKLDEDLKRLDSSILKRKKYSLEKAMFEQENKDNEVLKRYIKILESLKDAEDEIKTAKEYMYLDMLECDTDYIEGKYSEVSLKRPYFKKDFNSKQFYEDYKEDSPMYKAYIYMKEIKGNVNINEKE